MNPQQVRALFTKVQFWYENSLSHRKAHNGNLSAREFAECTESIVAYRGTDDGIL